MRIGSLVLGLGLAVAGSVPADAGQPLEPPGTRFEISPANLAAPSASVANPAQRVPRTSRDHLLVRAGFRADVFAEELDHPRWMAVAPNGDVFLAEPNSGQVTLLRDLDGDGRADLKRPFAIGFNRPHGLAFQPGALYVGDIKAIWRIPYKDGDLESNVRKPVTRPGAIGEGGDHWTRNLAFAPDGKSFFVAIGSRGNIDVEPQPHASVARFALDGAPLGIFASGLRNPVGIAFYPNTNDLYVVVNERDTYGDKLVPDYLTRLGQGDFFGWPYAYIGSHPDPQLGKMRPDLVARTKIPDLLFESHSAPIGLVFYDGVQFPQAYRGGAFVALRGSWNAEKPTGYKVVHVPFKDGRPVGWYETFVSGFWVRGTATAQVWGRPAGLAITKDGSLLIADDTSRTIWRVSYTGK
jgi:glucose/arabinose dehydrogenase